MKVTILLGINQAHAQAVLFGFSVGEVFVNLIKVNIQKKKSFNNLTLKALKGGGCSTPVRFLADMLYNF